MITRQFFFSKKKLPTGNDNEKEKKSVEFEKFHQKSFLVFFAII